MQIYRFCGIVAIKFMIMYLKNLKKYINALILGLLVASCSTKTIEEELEDWCNCEKQALENTTILDSCNQLMIDVSQKYEFDPEAVSAIQKSVKNCN